MQMLRRDPQYFYKILPYAEAMGMGQKFVALFHDCRLEPCQWFETARGTPVSASAFYESYADCLDKLQPFLHNTFTEGHTWKAEDIRTVRSQVEQRMSALKDFMPEVHRWVETNIGNAVAKGWLKEQKNTYKT